MKNSNEIKETLKRFATVIQISSNKFEVFFFNAESKSRLYPETQKHGILIASLESNKLNDKYIFYLADTMNTNYL